MHFRLFYFLAPLLLSLVFTSLWAQTDTTKKTTFVILDNEYSEFFQTKEGAIHQLVNEVKVRHGSDTLYCDTAILYQGHNRMDAIGNVAIFQEDGTRAFADYARYTGNDKTVYMTAKGLSDVQLTDEEGNSLWSKEIYYNLQTKIGYYKKDGILRSESTLIQSDEGTYNLNTKLARFKGNVYIKDKEYEVFSEELTYQTELKDVEFFAPSIIYSDSSIFRTSGGIYNELNKTGYFTTRSSLFHKEQYIESDTLYHNEIDSNSWAKGQVIILDTLEKAAIYAGYAEYIGVLDEVTVYDLPLLELLQEQDHSIFIKGDTFYVRQEQEIIELSEQDLLEKELEGLLNSEISLMEKIMLGDTILVFGAMETNLKFEKDGQGTKPFIHHPLLDENGLINADITEEDPNLQVTELFSLPEKDRGFLPRELLSNVPHKFFEQEKKSTQKIEEDHKIFIIYPHPVIFSDSLQAKADSMVYSQEFSKFSMFGAPVMWSNKQQITGEVIHVTMDQQAIKEFHVPSLGIMVAINDPEEANFYNQLQAQDIKGFFEKNELVRMEAKGNAASIYYLLDEEDAYLGVSEATTDEIEINLVDQEIDMIKYLGPTDQVMQPLHLANTEQKKLERFVWRAEEKISDWEAFFETTRQPFKPQLIQWDLLDQERWGSPSNLNEMEEEDKIPEEINHEKEAEEEEQ